VRFQAGDVCHDANVPSFPDARNVIDDEAEGMIARLDNLQATAALYVRTFDP
jgi:hypothetical protein